MTAVSLITGAVIKVRLPNGRIDSKHFTAENSVTRNTVTSVYWPGNDIQSPLSFTLTDFTGLVSHNTPKTFFYSSE